MCGIIGYISNTFNFTTAERKRFITQALYADALRGWDSTGVAGIKKDGSNATFKKAMPAADFIDLRRYGKWQEEMGSFDIVIGHNRAATFGKVCDKNAHPFEYNHIIGVHNGSLKHGWRDDLDLSNEQRADISVDSEAIFAQIAAKGHEQVLPNIHGAYALVWFDSIQGKLYLARNEERPLYYITTDDEKSIWYGSELSMLKWILHRNGIKFNSEKVFYIQPYTYIAISMDDPTNYDIVEYEEKELPKGHYQGPWNDQYGNYGRTKPSPLLSEWELKSNEEMVMFAVNWNAYSNSSNHGFLSGYKDGHPRQGIKCLVHGVSHNEWLTAKKQFGNNIIIEGAARSMTWEHKDPTQVEPCVILNGTDYTYKQDDKIRIPTEGGDDKKVVVLVKGPGNQMLTQGEFLNKTRNGCINCSGVISIPMADKVIWCNNEQDPLCPSCSEDLTNVMTQ